MDWLYVLMPIAGIKIFWVFRPALLKWFRFLIGRRFFNHGTAPAKGFRPL